MSDTDIALLDIGHLTAELDRVALAVRTNQTSSRETLRKRASAILELARMAPSRGFAESAPPPPDGWRAILLRSDAEDEVMCWQESGDAEPLSVRATWTDDTPAALSISIGARSWRWRQGPTGTELVSAGDAPFRVEGDELDFIDFERRIRAVVQQTKVAPPPADAPLAADDLPPDPETVEWPSPIDETPLPALTINASTFDFLDQIGDSDWFEGRLTREPRLPAPTVKARRARSAARPKRPHDLPE